MRLRHLVALGSLALSLAACGATATLAPGGGAQATAPTAVPSSGGSPAAGSGSPAAGGGGDAGDVSNLANATTKQMCTLLTSDEAKTIIGKPITIAPNGMAIKGLGTNCIYQTDDTMGDGTFIKVEIGGVSYKADVSLLGIGGGASSTTTVGGLDATAIDVTASVKEASLVVRLTDAAKPPSLLIQAPTVDMAKAVAELVIPRLAALK